MTDARVIFGLNGQEVAKLAPKATQEAQAESRRRGLPVATEVDGNLVIEHPDGRHEISHPTNPGYGFEA